MEECKYSNVTFFIDCRYQYLFASAVDAAVDSAPLVGQQVDA